MDKKNIIQQLDELAELEAQADAARLRYDARYEEIIAPLKAQLEELEYSRQEEVGVIELKIGQAREEIMDDVLAIGESVKGARLHAVWSKPRVTWDTSKLDGYAAAHPEIEAFRKVGKPSVSFRAVKP